MSSPKSPVNPSSQFSVPPPSVTLFPPPPTMSCPLSAFTEDDDIVTTTPTTSTLRFTPTNSNCIAESNHTKNFESYSGHADMIEYVSQSRMGDNATWATYIEIISAASLLDTLIVIHTQLSTGKKWLRYDPLCVWYLPCLIQNYVYT